MKTEPTFVPLTAGSSDFCIVGPARPNRSIAELLADVDDMLIEDVYNLPSLTLPSDN